jgi:hypothetical protein
LPAFIDRSRYAGRGGCGRRHVHDDDAIGATEDGNIRVMGYLVISFKEK